MTDLLPWLAAALFLVLTVALALGVGSAWRARWIVPALLSAAFAAFSVLAVLREGPLGFWPEHTRNLWGNQIWFDLLLAVGVALAWLLPKARALGMRPLPWLLLVVCTGSIGLCAMFARVLYLQEEKGRA
jgi:hypothetical protein